MIRHEKIEKSIMCITSKMIKYKTNEIPTIPKIFDKINVKENIITLNVLNIQKPNIDAIIKLKSDNSIIDKNVKRIYSLKGLYYGFL